MKKVSMLGAWLAVEDKLAKEGNEDIQQTIAARDQVNQDMGLPKTKNMLNQETNLPSKDE